MENYDNDGWKSDSLEEQNRQLRMKLDSQLNVAADEMLKLKNEIERLKRGDFTPQEFQDLCHHRDIKPGCTETSFREGCYNYWDQLFGPRKRLIIRAGLRDTDLDRAFVDDGNYKLQVLRPKVDERVEKFLQFGKEYRITFEEAS